MKFLQKKIFGFTFLEIGIGAFVLMNLSLIKNLFGIVSKPLENTVSQIQDTQIQSQSGMPKASLDWCKALAPKIYAHLDKTFVDEQTLCKLIGDNVLSLENWTHLKSYYDLKYGKDLVSELSDPLKGYFDNETEYKRLLKRSYIISDIW
jgi:hypothetical protein